VPSFELYARLRELAGKPAYLAEIKTRFGRRRNLMALLS